MNVFGLPLHPLVVHAVVILVPLAALGALLVVALPRLRPAYGWLTVAFAAAGAASAIVARISGQALAEDLALTNSARVARHMALGAWTPWPTLVLALSLAGFTWATRHRGEDRKVTLVRVSGAATVVAAVVSLVLVGLTGHAGAAAVWGT
ncbi:hypothetical protein IPV09_02680 [Tessaracoccus sp. SD287]|uniref:DUF2231 domain-containing protein n=1 Tax=Tessaracoccus sp. SD287 TaxID=2782008 RepID=UPI001A96A0C7|nr:DUF2231 domain-containing protein [Tessaracoccus sp. SD287]MBO1030239.1 hypothetical protein [Tessaracoccus sp. SD287]